MLWFLVISYLLWQLLLRVQFLMASMLQHDRWLSTADSPRLLPTNGWLQCSPSMFHTCVYAAMSKEKHVNVYVKMHMWQKLFVFIRLGKPAEGRVVGGTNEQQQQNHQQGFSLRTVFFKRLFSKTYNVVACSSLISEKALQLCVADVREIAQCNDQSVIQKNEMCIHLFYARISVQDKHISMNSKQRHFL